MNTKSINADLISQDINNLEKKTKDLVENKVMTKKHIITKVKQYILDNYDVRYDVIALKYEWKRKGESEYVEFNENDLYCELQEKGYNISIAKLMAIINSSWTNSYNPFQEYFRSLPKWDGKTDYIAQFSDFLDIDDKDYFVKHFKKWLVRVVACALIPSYFNKQMLLLVGEQNNGKTSLQRFICPPFLKGYYSEDLNPGKDELITLSGIFLILMDELSKLDRAGVEHVKQLMTKTAINFRPPYAKNNKTFTRYASFMGNTNKTEFLKDETGSVRFLCFNIRGIDFSYSKNVKMDNLYAQAYYLFNNNFQYEITKDEAIEIQRYNMRYQLLTPEQELIFKYFEPSDKADINARFMTSTEIAEEISKCSTLRITPNNVGSGLKFLGFIRVEHRRESSKHPVYGYWVKMTDELKRKLNYS